MEPRWSPIMRISGWQSSLIELIICTDKGHVQFSGWFQNKLTNCFHLNPTKGVPYSPELLTWAFMQLCTTITYEEI